jgi:hypothetical protein
MSEIALLNEEAAIKSKTVLVQMPLTQLVDRSSSAYNPWPHQEMLRLTLDYSPDEHSM